MNRLEVQQTLSNLKALEVIWGEKYLYENEYFRVFRFRENEFKARYRNNLFKVSYLYLLFLPSFFIKLIANILFIFFKPGKKIQSNDKKYDFLFVSHFTKSNPNYAQCLNENSDSESITIYFNHSKPNEKFELRLNTSRNRNILLLPKNLPIKASLESIIRIYLDALNKYLLLFFSGKFGSISDKRIIIGAIYSQISRRTISNHFIFIQFMEILQNSSISNVVIPFEGHAYEYVIKQACRISPKTKIIFFQHAPVSAGQFSMMEKTLIDNHLILFSSAIVRNWFISNEISSKAKSYTLGSPKFREVKDINSKSNIILLTPEGINASIFRFLKTLPKIEKVFRNYKIILRIHPDIRVSLINLLLIKLFLQANRLEISKSSLTTDLKKSTYCLFSASSVGLEAIPYKCIPIFLGSDLENELTNPLFVYSQKYKIFTFQEFNSKNKKLPSIKKFYPNYYNKLNPKIIYSNHRK
jgi:hypothetical protein